MAIKFQSMAHIIFLLTVLFQSDQHQLPKSRGTGLYSFTQVMRLMIYWSGTTKPCGQALTPYLTKSSLMEWLEPSRKLFCSWKPPRWAQGRTVVRMEVRCSEFLTVPNVGCCQMPPSPPVAQGLTAETLLATALPKARPFPSSSLYPVTGHRRLVPCLISEHWRASPTPELPCAIGRSLSHSSLLLLPNPASHSSPLPPSQGIS